MIVLGYIMRTDTDKATLTTYILKKRLGQLKVYFIHSGNRFYCGAFRDLVPFAQFKKREKHPWKSVNFSKVAG